MLIKISSCVFSNVIKSSLGCWRSLLGKSPCVRGQSAYVTWVFLRLRNFICCDTSCVYFFDFLSIPIKERIILAFISCLQEWERKMLSLCGLLFYLWVESSFLREGKLGSPPCFPFPMSLLFHLSPYFLSLWLGYNWVCQQDCHCLSGN